MMHAQQRIGALLTALRGRSGLIARTILSVGLIAGIAYHVGSADIIANFGAVSWSSVTIATAIFAISVVLVTPRWAMILSALGCRASWRDLLGSVFLGFLFNQLLPTAVGGDVLRAWQARRLGARWETAIHSVILDRGTGVLISLLGAAVLLPFASPHGGGHTLEWIVVAVAVLTAFGVAVLWALACWRNVTLPLPSGLHNSLARLHDNIWVFTGHFGATAAIFALATLNQMLPVAVIWILAKELNISLPGLDIALITFISTLAATVPISVAGWGIREGTLVYLFGLYGVPPNAAFTVSILYGLALTLSAAPGALMLLRGQPKAPAVDVMREEAAGGRAGQTYP
jgi:uncharacterized membrane protein YbhN (UPF0104 family)